MAWSPWLGAVPERTAERTRFRVWAPRARSLEVRIEGGKRAAMKADGEGYYLADVEGLGPGARYFYRFPDGSERPDPASLFQPRGVHGPSEVVDLQAIKRRTPLPATWPSWPRRGTRPSRSCRSPAFRASATGATTACSHSPPWPRTAVRQPWRASWTRRTSAGSPPSSTSSTTTSDPRGTTW